MRALGTNAGDVAVAGIDGHFVSQGEKLLADGAQNLRIGATPEIGSADAAPEQSIPGEKSRRFGEVTVRRGKLFWLHRSLGISAFLGS